MESKQTPYPSSALDETHADVEHALEKQGALLVRTGENRTVVSVRFALSPHTKRETLKAAFRETLSIRDQPGGDLSFTRLAVVPSHRNQGFGSSMISELQRLALSLGCTQMSCTARSQHPDNRPWYYDKGFVVTGYSEAYGINDLRTHLVKKLQR